MRQIGRLPNREQAQTFADYLVSIGVSAHIEESDLESAIWIRNEDDVDSSRKEFMRFVADPAGLKFTAGAAETQRLRLEEQLTELADVDDSPAPLRPLTARAPVLATIIGLTLFVFLQSFGHISFGTENEPLSLGQSNVGRSLLICDASRKYDPTGDNDGLVDVRRGQLWRLVTPAFVHFGVPQILFNLYVLYMWGGSIEARHGGALMLVLLLATTVTGNLAEYLISREVEFGGMTGFGLGLFGYIWIRMYVAPEDALQHHLQTIFLIMLLVTLGFTGVLDRVAGEHVRIANWAHLFGMLAGMAVAFIQYKLQPRQPAEKPIESLES